MGNNSNLLDELLFGNSKSSSSNSESKNTNSSTSVDINYSIKEVQKQLYSLQADIKKMETFIKESKNTENELNQKMDSFNKEVLSYKNSNEKNKVKTLEIFTIFISVFTFISVEIQILKTATNFFSIAGLSLLMWSMLIWFSWLILLFSETWIDIEGKWFEKIKTKFKYLMWSIWIIWIIWIILIVISPNISLWDRLIEKNNAIEELREEIKILRKQFIVQ